MSAIEETLEVGVPVSTAYNQWTQFKSFPRFMSAVTKVEQVRPAVTRWSIGYGPVRGEFAAEIWEQRPDSCLAWRSLGGRPAHGGEVSFDSAPSDRTVVTVRMTITTPGLAGLLTDVSGVVHRVVRRELGNFKEFIEGLGQEVGAWRGSIHNGHVQPVEPEPPRSHVPCWPVG
ncbi:SRPBCC family protein [Streptomyces reniochalinae]|uniref:SRPBCC family protein n=1 Tax=Streptomyces reniochalinae TaxID=2250578 RepID=A0A367EXA7_9ACTN|nr:SRPBCC family protein [Streptomyces reniochalinae]RCG22215.1 SRPBCC family protein [Streptomyces reniochalinae]